MNYSTNEGRSSRLVGFVDMAIHFDALSDASVSEVSTRVYAWHRPVQAGVALFEVKSAWPTTGNLLRQLNLYRASTALGFGSEGHRLLFVVAPDDTMNEMVCFHGYRLVTFERAEAWRFRLAPVR